MRLWHNMFECFCLLYFLTSLVLFGHLAGTYDIAEISYIRRVGQLQVKSVSEELKTVSFSYLTDTASPYYRSLFLVCVELPKVEQDNSKNVVPSENLVTWSSPPPSVLDVHHDCYHSSVDLLKGMGCWWWREEVIYCATWRRTTDFSDSWGWVIALILHGDLHLLSIVQRFSFQTKCFLFSFIDVEEMVSALVDTSNIQDSKYPMIELLLKHKALSQLMVMTWNTILKVSSRISLKIPKKREKKRRVEPLSIVSSSPFL